MNLPQRSRHCHERFGTCMNSIFAWNHLRNIFWCFQPTDSNHIETTKRRGQKRTDNIVPQLVTSDLKYSWLRSEAFRQSSPVVFREVQCNGPWILARVPVECLGEESADPWSVRVPIWKGNTDVSLIKCHVSLTSFHAFSLEWSQVMSRPSFYFCSVIARCESFWSSRRDCVPSTHQTSPVYSTRSSDVVGILMVGVKTGFRMFQVPNTLPLRFHDLPSSVLCSARPHDPFPGMSMHVLGLDSTKGLEQSRQLPKPVRLWGWFALVSRDSLWMSHASIK